MEVVCLPQSSGTYAVAKLDRGDLDVAVLGSTPWAMAVSRGVDLSAFYVTHSKGDSQGLVTRDTIATPRDLHGKTIATPFGSTAHQHLLFLREILKPGVAFNLVNSPPSRAALEPLWASGAIDGAFCWGDGFMWLKTVGKLMITARTLGHWGVETFNVVAARREVAASLPGLLEHLAGQLAALDASFLEADSVEGTSDEWMIERADGYLTSVADVITVGDTAPPPSVYDDAAREDALVALRLFELIDATTMAGCEWLGCAASVRGLVAKSSDASSFLYGQKLLARLAPPGQPAALAAHSPPRRRRRRCWRRRKGRGSSSPRAAAPPRGAAPPASGRRARASSTLTARKRRADHSRRRGRRRRPELLGQSRVRVATPRRRRRAHPHHLLDTARVGGRHAHRACRVVQGPRRRRARRQARHRAHRRRHAAGAQRGGDNRRALQHRCEKRGLLQRGGRRRRGQ